MADMMREISDRLGLSLPVFAVSENLLTIWKAAWFGSFDLFGGLLNRFGMNPV
jgi:hypothetical protein